MAERVGEFAGELLMLVRELWWPDVGIHPFVFVAVKQRLVGCLVLAGYRLGAVETTRRIARQCSGPAAGRYDALASRSCGRPLIDPTLWAPANMVAHVSIERLRGDLDLIEALADSFDFIVTDDATPVLAFSVEPKANIQLAARDKSGGEFLLYGGQERVLHVTSEGQAGVVARDLTEFLRLLVAHPYWFDLLHFSDNGQLDEMKKAADALRESSRLGRSGRRLETHRRLLSERLGLGDTADAIDRLHAAVADLGRDIHVLGPDGSRYDSLFNRFSSEQLRPDRGHNQPMQRTGAAGTVSIVRKLLGRGPGR